MPGQNPSIDFDPRRFSRHLLLPEIGLEGQTKLKRSSVLVVGAGGLGSPVLLYLAAAGVGHLGVIDSDTLELSNLQRQVLHTTDGLAKPKVKSAESRLKALWPDLEVTAMHQRLTSSNAQEVLKGYEAVVDGTDGFATRYLLNDACLLHSVPLIYGSVYRFEGQVSVFYPGKGPCYRCLFPEPPPPALSPSCSEAGVLGVLPGLIGMLQATEALKLLLGIGRPLIGRLLLYDALSTRFLELALPQNPSCPACGEGRGGIVLEDYEAFCHLHQEEEAEIGEADFISPKEAQALMGAGAAHLIDVRAPSEWQLTRIEGAISFPLSRLESTLQSLPMDKTLILCCHFGHRSLEAAVLLQKAGLPRPKILRGGLEAWAADVEGEMLRY